jgi:hypothetical protein
MITTTGILSSINMPMLVEPLSADIDELRQQEQLMVPNHGG